MKTNIKSFTLDELKEEMQLLGEKPFRAEQIFKWIHQENVQSFDEMTNLSLDLRDTLKHDFCFSFLSLVKEECDKDVNKYLFKLKIKVFSIYITNM